MEPRIFIEPSHADETLVKPLNKLHMTILRLNLIFCLEI